MNLSHHIQWPIGFHVLQSRLPILQFVNSPVYLHNYALDGVQQQYCIHLELRLVQTPYFTPEAVDHSLKNIVEVNKVLEHRVKEIRLESQILLDNNDSLFDAVCEYIDMSDEFHQAEAKMLDTKSKLLKNVMMERAIDRSFEVATFVSDNRMTLKKAKIEEPDSLFDIVAKRRRLSGVPPS